MSFTPEELTDQNWHPGNKFSLFGYLKYLCFKVLYTALVGKSSAPDQVLSIPVHPERGADPRSRTVRFP
jgi:hypothetical protein